MKSTALLLSLFCAAPAASQALRAVVIRPDIRSEPGKPFSATVTEITNQTLQDGTHVTRTTVTLEYRDPEGRTRQEVTSEVPAGPLQPRITIHDPVADVTYTLFPNDKVATRSHDNEIIQTTVAGGGVGPRAATRGAGVTVVRRTINLPDNTAGAFSVSARGGRRGGRGSVSSETSEDLGTISVNGVPAHGARITTTIPLGAIGNDREFHSVSESWFSPDLNLLIKSVSNDPRFGITTYELTNISRNPPDPALFRPPTDYTLR